MEDCYLLVYKTKRRMLFTGLHKQWKIVNYWSIKPREECYLLVYKNNERMLFTMEKSYLLVYINNGREIVIYWST